MRGRCAFTSRLIRGRRILVTTRGKACPVLNVMGNTLPPLLVEFRAPLLQLRDDTFNARGLLNCTYADLRGLMCGNGGFRKMHRGVFGVRVEPFSKFL